VVQLVVVAAVEAAAVAPAAAKAAVVAVVAAPSVVGATLRSSFQLGRGTATLIFPLLLLNLPPPPFCTCSDNQRLWDKGQCLGAQSFQQPPRDYRFNKLLSLKTRLRDAAATFRLSLASNNISWLVIPLLPRALSLELAQCSEWGCGD
jgi:hypothetical protein